MAIQIIIPTQSPSGQLEMKIAQEIDRPPGQFHILDALAIPTQAIRTWVNLFQHVLFHQNVFFRMMCPNLFKTSTVDVAPPCQL